MQTRTKTTWTAIVGSADFRQGVEDFRAGRPWRTDDPKWRGTRGGVANYERGRHYAAACAGAGDEPMPLKYGRRVSQSAIRHALHLGVR